MASAAPPADPELAKIVERLGVPEDEAAQILALKRVTGQAPPEGAEAALDAAAEDAVAALGLSEDALALEFTARHGHELRYVASWNKWLSYEGGVWRDDSRMRVFDLARNIAREKAAAAEKEWIRSRVASARTVAAIVRLASADPKHARVPEDFDGGLFELNTPGGIVYDLRTGAPRPAKAGDGHTKQTAVAPGGEAPLWDSCLDVWTDGDGELKAFKQRLFGYCLTGSTREHVLPFFLGGGGNGKGVELNTVMAVMGDYAGGASTDTFTAAQGDRHPADLAMLRGRRLVVAQEVEQGRRWDEARLKSLTGGDPVTARFMRGDFFTFTPTFKVVVAANHKPGLRSVDEAIRRRLLLIPFTVTIPPEKRDPRLPERLKAEWPGILAWMIRGCLAWQAEGLRPPSRVLDASAAYFEDQNAFQAWLDEATLAGPGLVAATSALYTSWKSWADARGEWAGTARHLSERLQSAGFEAVKDTVGLRGRGFRGLGLKP